MICARESGDKADYPRILAIVSAKERAERLMSVGLRINEATESCEPIDNPTTPTTSSDGGLIKAVVVDSHTVVQDLLVAAEATILETNESTPSDSMVRDLILNQMVENISSDLRLKDVVGLTSPPVKN